MMSKYIIKIKVRSSLLIGGYYSSLLVDSATARTSQGEPVIPASALKGALRIEMERLARAQQKGVCLGSDPASSCGVVEDPCLVCILFGSPGLVGKLRFYDARLEELAAGFFTSFEEGASAPGRSSGYGVRNGVTISRRRRVAEEGQLYDMEVLSSFFPELVFQAPLDLLEDLEEEEMKYLEAAVVSLPALGGKKTTGLGHLKAWLELGQEYPQEERPPEESSHDGGGDKREDRVSLAEGEYVFQLTLLPQEMLRAGGLKTKESFFEGLDFIPGSAVRGALAREYSRFLTQGWDSPDFKEEFLIEPIRFSDFYPSKRERPYARPVPLSLRTCKVFPGFKFRESPQDKKSASHGCRDILLESAAVKILNRKGYPLILDDRCPVKGCGQAMVNLSGYYSPGDNNEDGKNNLFTRFNTKTAINRKRWQSEEGKLYTYELMEPVSPREESPLVFSGTLSGVKGKTAPCIEGLNGREILVGGARSRGLGRVMVQVDPPQFDSPSIEGKKARERMDSFTRTMNNYLSPFIGELYPDDPLENHSFFTITLLSDLVLPPGPWDQELCRELSLHLGIPREDLNLEKAMLRSGYRGGYNLLLGIPKDFFPVISRGSAFVFSLPRKWREKDEFFQATLPLTYDGIGLLREEGLGKAVFCDPIHLKDNT